jgi:hypothetical protein
MSHCEDNLALLIERHPHLKQKLGTPPSLELAVVSSKSGAPTGVVSGRYIHSRFNPVQEASRIVDQEYCEEVTAYLFYGFGLGYQVEIFLAKHPDVPVVVIEPDPSFFVKALAARDLRVLLGNPNLKFFIGDKPEALPNLLDGLPSSHLKAIPLRSLLARHGRYYRRLDGIIKAYRTRNKINLNTLDRFGKLWVKNLTENIRLLLKASGVQKLENAFEAIPAVVLASGPSLDLALPLLGELRRRFLIIAVDTSLNACLDWGVEPDFLVVVDPQYWNTRHIDRATVKNTILVSESSTNPRIFRILDLPTFFGSSLFPLGRYLESFIGEKGKLGAGGSVATTAWDLARLAGCNPIFMAGLDLGFPNGVTHFKGAFFEDRFHASSNRLKPSEEMSLAYLYQAYPFTISSNSGGEVLTDHRMVLYKWWFENQIKLFPAIQTFTLSTHGARIDGMEYRDSESLLGFPNIRDRIERRLIHVRRLASEQTDYRANDSRRKVSSTKETLKAAVEELLVELGRLGDLASKALSDLDEFEAASKAGAPDREYLESLARIDGEILSMSSRHVASFLLQSLIRRIEGENQERKGSGALHPLKSSRDLYGELKQSAAYHVKLLEKALLKIHL